MSWPSSSETTGLDSFAPSVLTLSSAERSLKGVRRDVRLSHSHINTDNVQIVGFPPFLIDLYVIWRQQAIRDASKTKETR